MEDMMKRRSRKGEACRGTCSPCTGAFTDARAQAARIDGC